MRERQSRAPLGRRALGPLSVSTVGLGCMELSGRYGSVARGQALSVIATAMDEGVTLLDTSDRYGAGSNEELVGEAIKSHRGKVLVCTKFGHVLGPTGEVIGEDGRPGHVIAACEASLRRLQVDYIDLYLQHRVDTRVPIEDTVGAMASLVQQGKVRSIGLCEVRPETIRRAHGVHPIAAVQSEYSLWWRDVESNVLPTCRELQIGFIAYAPLGRGLLTGMMTGEFANDDRRRDHPRFQGENLGRNLRLVTRLRKIADDKNCTVSQLALAWLISKNQDVVPIFGTTSVKHLRENLAAVHISLSANEVAEVDRVMPAGTGAGLRYPLASMASVDK